MAFVNVRQMVAERDEALLSMDEQKIKAYMRRYNVHGRTAPSDLFWRIVHKARTGSEGLPMIERIASKMWLDRIGSQPLDGGEIAAFLVQQPFDSLTQIMDQALKIMKGWDNV